MNLSRPMSIAPRLLAAGLALAAFLAGFAAAMAQDKPAAEATVTDSAPASKRPASLKRPPPELSAPASRSPRAPRVSRRSFRAPSLRARRARAPPYPARSSREPQRPAPRFPAPSSPARSRSSSRKPRGITSSSMKMAATAPASKRTTPTGTMATPKPATARAEDFGFAASISSGWSKAFALPRS